MEETQLGDLSVDDRMIYEEGCQIVDCTQLAEETVRWQALVSTVEKGT
jgi:hypothetical protein